MTTASDTATLAVQPRATHRGRPLQRRLGRLLLHMILLCGAVIMVGPFVWVVSTSLKTQADIVAYPPQLIPHPLVLDNYSTLFAFTDMLRYMVNSVGVVTVIVAGQLLTCSLAAYAFARLQFRGRDVLFLAYLGTMMIPSQVTLIPGFILMKYLGWIDTYFALTVPFMLFTAFGTFLLRQSFLAIPAEIEQAARVDGCGYLLLYARIALPLAKPALATVAVFASLYFWNDFLWPLIVTNSDVHRTLQVGLALAEQNYGSAAWGNWGTITAGAAVAAAPMVLAFLFAQRYFVQGIVMTGLKG
jgi:multiple sugar transport system permease protein